MYIKFLILFLLPIVAFAQSEYNWGAINHRIDAKPFAGKRFKLQAAVKVDLIDATAAAEIWVRVDKPKNKIGFFYNMTDKPIRSNKWGQYSIEGKIDSDASFFAFGGLFNKQGIFYFDNFQLFIESSEGEFKQIDIENGDFEMDSLSYWPYRSNPSYVLSVTKETAFSGKQCCRVDGSKVKRLNTYGDNDSTGKYALINGIKIYYEEYGKGEPLLMLHGNRASIESFKSQIPEFSKHYHLILADTRGQGKSTEDGKKYTYDLFAEDMNLLLDYLKIDSANVLGWSDGGNTGLIMAMKYPRKVKKLVTMGANIFIDKSVVAKWVFKELDQQIKDWHGDTSYTAQNDIRLTKLLQTEPNHSFEELKSISCPVLVMAGEKDVIKIGHTKNIAKNIKHSTLLIAPKETHYYPSQNPTTFNATVLNFLKKINIEK